MAQAHGAKRPRYDAEGVEEPALDGWNYTVTVANVPADYTHATLLELHEAANIDVTSLESSRFEPQDPSFCKVKLRYIDEKSAKIAADALDGQEVAGEADIVRKLQTQFSWTKGPGEIKPSVYVSDIPVEYEESDVRSLHRECGLDEDKVISMKFLSSRDPTQETRSCIVRYNDKASAEAAIKAFGGKVVIVTSSGREKHLGARMAKPARWMVDSGAADGPMEAGGASKKQKKQEVPKVTPEKLAQFCEKWKLTPSTREWLKAQSVEVQTGIVNRYEDPKELAGKNLEAPEGSIVITGLPEDADVEFVEALLSMYGACSKCEISFGTAVIVMECEEDGNLVVEEMNGITPEGLEKPLAAKFASSKDRDKTRDAAIKQLGKVLQYEHAQTVAAAYRRGLPPPPPPGSAAPPPPAPPPPATPVDTKGLIPGQVKFWNAEKKFGFIKADGGGDDIFVHVNQLHDGDMLAKDASVFFDADKEEKTGKWRATIVVGACWSAAPDPRKQMQKPLPPPQYPPPPSNFPFPPPPHMFPPQDMMVPLPGAGMPRPAPSAKPSSSDKVALGPRPPSHPPVPQSKPSSSNIPKPSQKTTPSQKTSSFMKPSAKKMAPSSSASNPTPKMRAKPMASKPTRDDDDAPWDDDLSNGREDAGWDAEVCEDEPIEKKAKSRYSVKRSRKPKHDPF